MESKNTNTSIHNYVAYIIAPYKKDSNQFALSNEAISIQEQQIKKFLTSEIDSRIIRSFIETNISKRGNSSWQELDRAIQFCQENHARLIIGEIKNLLSNQGFTNKIFNLLDNKPNIKLVFCDQPYINKENFKLLVAHAIQQKKIHGELVKKGLSKANAKSGNPNAINVIKRVNKPKIDNSIIFSLIITPVIESFKANKYSQRKMVSVLNNSDFKAPEGGYWVLSQLQKVIDRIKLNTFALDLEELIKEYQKQNLSIAQIRDAFNQKEIACFKGEEWTEQTVVALLERSQQLADIRKFNQFTLKMLPILKEHRMGEFDEIVLIKEIERSNIIEKSLESKNKQEAQ